MAIKAFGMGFDTEDRDPNAGGRANPDDFDPSVIPKIVDGAGDTFGPNHKEDIGRTWVAAQLAGGVAPFFVDIRTPMEMAAGSAWSPPIPRAEHQRPSGCLPPKDERVTVYDQTGEQGSIELAAWLREQNEVSHGDFRAATPSGSSMARTSNTSAHTPRRQCSRRHPMAGSDEGQFLDRAADGSVWCGLLPARSPSSVIERSRVLNTSTVRAVTSVN